jgi:tetrahydromethanopterin S-methyltransferase subunit G
MREINVLWMLLGVVIGLIIMFVVFAVWSG